MKQEDILNKFSTPFYLFDLDILENRIKYLKEKLGNIDLCYAVKANTFIIDTAKHLVSRLEICSEGEYDICEKLNVDPTKMVISGVYKTPSFIEKLVSTDKPCIYTTESYNQFLLLESLVNKYHKKIKIMPRLTSGNQFGINEEELIDIINKVKDNDNYDLVGIEYFSGTQKYSLKKITREFEFLKSILERIKNECNYNITEIEYGSGFPVEYFNEKSFNEEEFLAEFKNLVLVYFKDLKITLELGRSIASSSGLYYTSVVDIKRNSVGNFAIVDGGMNHLVYYGQTMAMKFPEFELFPKKEGNEELFNICGSLCTINDIIVKQLPVRSLSLGDTFIFKNTGAYCMTEGISLFLSRDLPKIILKKGDNLMLVRDIYKTSTLNTPNI